MTTIVLKMDQVNLIWGSHVMDPDTGVIFNDEMGKQVPKECPALTFSDDFAVPGAADAFGVLPSPWNYPAPGKRCVAYDIISDPHLDLYPLLRPRSSSILIHRYMPSSAVPAAPESSPPSPR